MTDAAALGTERRSPILRVLRRGCAATVALAWSSVDGVPGALASLRLPRAALNVGGVVLVPFRPREAPVPVLVTGHRPAPGPHRFT